MQSLITELEWRGMVLDMMPETKDSCLLTVRRLLNLKIVEVA